MDKIAGIVAEFNPFHHGHAALIRSVREQGAEGVVAVMSGNFVQRGSAAVTDKRVRARAALHCGVDLVLELPLAYAAAPAQRFARGGLSILAATGCVTTLAFGSECGDADALRQVAEALDGPVFGAALQAPLESGVTFAKARQAAAAKLLGEEAAKLLRSPNNLLGIEYLRAAAQLGWHPEVFTIPRAGASHDSERPRDGIASASYLRLHGEDVALLRRHTPEKAFRVYEGAMAAGFYPAAPQQLEIAVLSHLRRLGPNDLAGLPDLSEGIENRLYAAIRSAGTLRELEQAVKTKRYTMARIRRLILSAFLGITQVDALVPVPYARILGFGPGGREILAKMKSRCGLPVSQSLAKLRAQGERCERFAALEERATDLYGLCLPKPLPCGYEYSASAALPTGGTLAFFPAL